MIYKVGDKVKVRTSGFDYGTIESVDADLSGRGSYEVRMATPSRALHHYYGDQIEPNTAANWGVASQASQKELAIGASLNDQWRKRLDAIETVGAPKKLPVGSRAPDDQNPEKIADDFCAKLGILPGMLRNLPTATYRAATADLVSRVMRDAHARGYEAGTKVADRALQPKIDRIAELEKPIDGHQKAANAADALRIKQIEEIKRLEGELDDSRDSGKSLMKQITDNAMLKAAEPMIIVKSQQLTDVSTIDMAAELAKRGFTNFGQAITQVDVTRANGVVTTHQA